jgi:ATP-dependent DNA helicase RecG
MIRNGHQVALLAPTEILVEQHYQRIRQLLDHTVVVARGTGSMSAGERRTLLAGLRDGYIQLVVGTHASSRTKSPVQVPRPGHRRRAASLRRGAAAEAVRERRTAGHPGHDRDADPALARAGDLRRPRALGHRRAAARAPAITTAVRAAHDVERVYDFVDEQIGEGAQAYIVYPIIEESEKTNLKPLTRLRDDRSAAFRIAAWRCCTAA